MAKAAKKAASKGASNESKSVIPRDRAKSYTVSDVKTASGKRKSIDTNDEVAVMLRGKSVEELQTIAARYGLEDRFKEKWAHLNPGMIRMSFGNALRGVMRQKAAAKAEKEAKKAEPKVARGASKKAA